VFKLDRRAAGEWQKKIEKGRIREKIRKKKGKIGPDDLSSPRYERRAKKEHPTPRGVRRDIRIGGG